MTQPPLTGARRAVPGSHRPEAAVAASAASIQYGGSSVATAGNTCSVSRLGLLRSHWTFASHRGNLVGGNCALRQRYRLSPPALRRYPPAEECTGSHQLAHFTACPACNTSGGRRTAEGPECRAIGPSPHLLVSPHRGAGLRDHWAMGHVSLGKWGKGGGGGTLSHWARSAVNQGDIRRRPLSGFVDWRSVFPGKTRGAGFRVRWEEGAGREAEAGEL